MRKCVQCYSYQISDEMTGWSPPLFLFALEGFRFPLRIYKSSLSETERICVDLGESEVGRICVNLTGYECGCMDLNQCEWD